MATQLSSVAAERDDALAELSDLQVRMDEAFEERRSARSKGAATPTATAARSGQRQGGEEDHNDSGSGAHNNRWDGSSRPEGNMVRHSSESTRSTTSNEGSQEGEGRSSRKKSNRNATRANAARTAQTTRPGSGDYASGAGLSTRGPQQRPAR